MHILCVGNWRPQISNLSNFDNVFLAQFRFVLTNFSVMNDIVSRLKHFLQQMGINTSSFADVCGIPRPSFSQLLSGRNKKVSNEVIDKIHNAYPELSMMWLMFGDGDMLVPNANMSQSGNDAQSLDSDFPGNAQTTAPRESHVQQSIKFDDDEPTSFQPRVAPAAQRQASIVDHAIATARAKGSVAASRAGGSGMRQITQVVIIYSDGSTQVITP